MTGCQGTPIARWGAHGSGGIPEEEKVRRHGGARRREGSREEAREETVVRHPEAPRDGAALRLPPRVEGRAPLLGGTEGARARSVRQAHRSEERRVGKECRSRWSP